MLGLPSNTMVSGPAEVLIGALFPSRFDSHCQLWRWHLHTRDDDKRLAAVEAELAKMIAERRV
jgi:hypothetical protein